MAEVQLPDGNVANVPDFALEKTQADMRSMLAAMVGADEKALKLYQNIVKNAKEQLDQSDKAASEALAEQKENGKALKNIADAAQKGKFTGEDMLKGVKTVDSFLTKTLLGFGATALTGAGILASSIKGLGDELLDLQKVGVGFTDVGGSAENLIADLQFLGLSSGQAAGLMEGYAGVVQTMGKTGFSEIQKTFSALSDSGNRFGLSIAESAQVLAEDLELRRTLGMMGNMDANQQATRSAELYDMQMKAAQALGKSVEDIRAETGRFIDSNIQAQLALAQLGDTAGPAALHAMEQLGTSLAGVVDSGLGDDILTAMAEPVFGASESSKNLFAALSASGDAGQKLAADIAALNDLKNTDPDAYASEVAKMGPKIKSALAEIRMDPEAAKNIAAFSAQNHAAAGAMQQLFTSGSKAVSANEAAINSAGGLQSGLARGAQAFDAAMATVTNSFKGITTDFTASFAGPMSSFADAVSKDTLLRNEHGEILDKNGKVMQQQITYTDALTGETKTQLQNVTDVNKLTAEQRKQTTGTISIMSAFKDAMSIVRTTMNESFGIVGDNTEGFAETIRSKIVPAIQGFAAWFEGDGFQSIKNTFSLLGGVLSGVYDGLVMVKDVLMSVVTAGLKFTSWIGSFFGSGDAEEDGKEASSLDWAGIGKNIGLSIVGLLAFTKAIKIATSVSKGVGAAKSFFGGAGGAASSVTGAAGGAGGAAGGAGGIAKGGAGFTKTIAKAGTNIGVAIKNLGKGIGGAIQGLAEGIGKGVAAVGKGIGGALGGILKGLASGLTAFANPAILLGAGILGGAITLIGAGIAGAAWIMGSALPTFAEGLDSFANIDGDNLVNVAKGIGAVGLAMAAMGAGGAAGAVGSAVSGIVDGIAGFFGADDPLDKLNEFAAYEFDVAKVLTNAGAVQAFGEAMTSLGAGAGLSSIGGVMDGLASMGEMGPMDLLRKFSEEKIDLAGLDNNLLAMQKLTDIFAMFNALPSAQNATQTPVAASSVSKSTSGGGSGEREQARDRRLMQPGVMAVDKNGNPVDTGYTKDQTASAQAQALATPGTQAKAGSNSSTTTGTNETEEVFQRIEAHLAAIAGNTGKSTKQLKQLDRTIQDDF